MAARRRHASDWLRLLLVPMRFTLLSMAFGACASAQSPPAPSSPDGPVPGSPTTGMAAQPRRRVSRDSANRGPLSRLPGYGGQYYDSAGNLNVYLIDTTRSTEAVELFTPILKAHRRGGPGHVIVRQGQYDIGQLQEWFYRALAGGIPELVMAGVDQAHNRIVLGIDKARERQGRIDVARILGARGIPSEAVIVTATQAAVPAVAIDTIRR